MEPFEELEHKFGEWAGVANPVACSSGTAALHLALASLNLPRGSRVIVPEFTMIACARAVTAAGLVPIFVDCTNDLLMDVDKLEDCLTPNWAPETWAVMPVHIYGRHCPMDPICDFADRYNLKVIEDMAEIHGVSPHRFSDAACWSFYQNKIIHGQEGGLVSFAETYDGYDQADRAKQLRSLGFTARHDFLHVPGGWNSRMSNAHAKLILESLAAYEESAKRRRQVEAFYNELVPAEWQMPPRDAVWVYDLRLPGVDAPAVVRRLNDQGIEARMAFRPMSEQPEYRGHFRHLNAYRLSREVLYLPVRPSMTHWDVERTVEELKQAVAHT